VTVSTGASACSGISLGDGASLKRICSVPIHCGLEHKYRVRSGRSEQRSDYCRIFRIEFASRFFVCGRGDYGIPYTVVDSSTQPLVSINVGAYASESDVAEAPFPPTAPIEGQPADCSSPFERPARSGIGPKDLHCCMKLTHDPLQWRVLSRFGNNLGYADLRGASLGLTSADAAGLSIFPGLVRYDEVAAGAINHAIRFTLQDTRNDSNDGILCGAG